MLAPSHESSCIGLHMCKCPDNNMQEYQKQPINVHLLNNYGCHRCWCKLFFYIIKNLILYSWTDLFELLAGELFQLRRFSDLVLSFVLEFLPLILQVVRYASTAVDKRFFFSFFIQISGGKSIFSSVKNFTLQNTNKFTQLWLVLWAPRRLEDFPGTALGGACGTEGWHPRVQ